MSRFTVGTSGDGRCFEGKSIFVELRGTQTRIDHLVGIGIGSSSIVVVILVFDRHCSDRHPKNQSTSPS